MDKLALLNRIRDIYESSNANIMKWLKEQLGENHNDITDILISYDFQAGTYIDYYLKNRVFQDDYFKRMVSVIDGLEDWNRSLLECGCGEATAIVPILNMLQRKFDYVGGIDISWSRLKYGKEFSGEYCDCHNISFAVGDMFNLPCADNSFDVVITREAIEPNRGKEKDILKELYRVANNYLVLVEPAYELASADAKERMDEHGYIQNLYSSAQELGYNVVTWELYGKNEEPLNPVGIMIIKKCFRADSKPLWVCPVTKTKLEDIGGALYSAESLLTYPIIKDIPVLTKESAIITTKMEKFM